MYTFSNHLLKDYRVSSSEEATLLLWPEATTFLSHMGAYSWPEARLNPGQIGTL